MNNSQAIGSTKLSGCISFEKYAVGTEFGLNFALGWYRFAALSGFQPWVSRYDTNPPTGVRIGLAFKYPGILVNLPTPVQHLELEIGMHSGWAIELLALDAAGAEVAAITVPAGHTIHRVTLSSNASPMVQVQIKGGTGEDVLLEICLDNQLLEQLLNDATDVAKIDKEEIRKILKDPKAQGILGDIERDFRRLEGGDDPGGENGGGGGFGINWPPDWKCVLANLALMAAASYLVTLVAGAIGAATFAGLAKADAIALLISTFGVSEATAEVVWLIFGGMSWVAVAADCCS